MERKTSIMRKATIVTTACEKEIKTHKAKERKKTVKFIKMAGFSQCLFLLYYAQLLIEQWTKSGQG